MRLALKNNIIRDFKTFLVNTKRDFCIQKSNKEKVIISSDRQGNRFIQIDDVKIAIDCYIKDADIIYISHAHMDHIPIMSKKEKEKLFNYEYNTQFICSKITKEIAEVRTNKQFGFPKEKWLLNNNSIESSSIEVHGITLTLIPNGHTYGSTSLFIQGSENVFYTSDFITEVRHFPNGDIIKGLSPTKCNNLIMECTFGTSKFEFPPFNELKFELIRYIEHNLINNIPVILLAYSFGKSQHVLKLLKDAYNIILERIIAQNTRILERNGIVFPIWQPYGKYSKKKLLKSKNYILIIPPYFIYRDPYKTLIDSGSKVVALSGKILLNSFREKFLADNYFAFSDHCDYNSLTNFFQACDPERVFFEHGTLNEFIYSISRMSQKKKIFMF